MKSYCHNLLSVIRFSHKNLLVVLIKKGGIHHEYHPTLEQCEMKNRNNL